MAKNTHDTQNNQDKQTQEFNHLRQEIRDSIGAYKIRKAELDKQDDSNSYLDSHPVSYLAHSTDSETGALEDKLVQAALKSLDDIKKQESQADSDKAPASTQDQDDDLSEAFGRLHDYADYALDLDQDKPIEVNETEAPSEASDTSENDISADNLAQDSPSEPVNEASDDTDIPENTSSQDVDSSDRYEMDDLPDLEDDLSDLDNCDDTSNLNTDLSDLDSDNSVDLSDDDLSLDDSSSISSDAPTDDISTSAPAVLPSEAQAIDVHKLPDYETSLQDVHDHFSGDNLQKLAQAARDKSSSKFDRLYDILKSYLSDILIKRAKDGFTKIKLVTDDVNSHIVKRYITIYHQYLKLDDNELGELLWTFGKRNGILVNDGLHGTYLHITLEWGKDAIGAAK